MDHLLALHLVPNMMMVCLMALSLVQVMLRDQLIASLVSKMRKADLNSHHLLLLTLMA